MAENCREKIVSEDYVDFIWQPGLDQVGLAEQYPDLCIQPINDYYSVFYAGEGFYQGSEGQHYEYDYEVFPTLYSLLQTEALEDSGILRLQNQPLLRLKGEGVLLGFIDTGIDYRNRCFLDEFGRSRILAIWDQGDQTGQLPQNIGYGSVYVREQIEEALVSDQPYRIVPGRDVSGHGTRLAALAAGSEDPETGWLGAAPRSMVAMVKLKPAKTYLKRYFMGPPEAEAYQENDIMLGVRFLHELAYAHKMPLVLCLALGTNMGGHTGTLPLSSYLNAISARAGRCVVVAAGNEANQGHHYYGVLQAAEPYQDVDLRVAENEYGLLMELWSSTPDLISVSLISPSGEEVPRINPGQKSWRFDFLFERTVVYVNFQPLDPYSGEQLIVIRMAYPSPGIWRIRVYGSQFLHGVYNIWLPVTGFLSPDTVFLNSNPDITVTDPGNAELPITTGAYNTRNRSIYIDSSRGYTRNGRIKPDLAVPGVSVATYGPGNRFTSMNGTSAAAAITAGAAALMLEWGVVKKNRELLSTIEVKQLLIRGADRSGNDLYPNRSWGYGTLNLYGAFAALGRF